MQLHLRLYKMATNADNQFDPEMNSDSDGEPIAKRPKYNSDTSEDHQGTLRQQSNPSSTTKVNDETSSTEVSQCRSSPPTTTTEITTDVTTQAGHGQGNTSSLTTQVTAQLIPQTTSGTEMKNKEAFPSITEKTTHVPLQKNETEISPGAVPPTTQVKVTSETSDPELSQLKPFAPTTQATTQAHETEPSFGTVSPTTKVTTQVTSQISNAEVCQPFPPSLMPTQTDGTELSQHGSPQITTPVISRTGGTESNQHASSPPVTKMTRHEMSKITDETVMSTQEASIPITQMTTQETTLNSELSQDESSASLIQEATQPINNTTLSQQEASTLGMTTQDIPQTTSNTGQQQEAPSPEIQMNIQDAIETTNNAALSHQEASPPVIQITTQVTNTELESQDTSPSLTEICQKEAVPSVNQTDDIQTIAATASNTELEQQEAPLPLIQMSIQETSNTEISQQEPADTEVPTPTTNNAATQQEASPGMTTEVPTQNKSNTEMSQEVPSLMQQTSYIEPDAAKIYSKYELGKLMCKAMEFVRSQQKQKKVCRVMYRNKLVEYFEEIKNLRNGIMEVYLKDENGDQRCPINKTIKGLFFGTRVNACGNLPETSPFGPRRLKIPAKHLLNKTRKIYFADFYCNQEVKRQYAMHYITIVLVDNGSKIDEFCKKFLIELNMNNNEFINVSNGDVMVTTEKVNIEVFYTENIDVKIESMEKYGGNFCTVKSTGTSTPMGIPKITSCPICNIFTPYY